MELIDRLKELQGNYYSRDNAVNAYHLILHDYELGLYNMWEIASIK